MRPPNKEEEEGELIVQKVSSDSLSILGNTFTFDSVADTDSTQVRFLRTVYNYEILKINSSSFLRILLLTMSQFPSF